MKSVWDAKAPEDKVLLLAAAVLIPTLATLVTFIGAAPYCDKGTTWLLVVTVGFAICEPMVFHIEARNEAVSMSPTDIPLAVGLLLLSPLSLVAARLIGSGLSLIVLRRPPRFKLIVNLTAFVAEATVATVVLRQLVDLDADASPMMWAALAASTFIGLFVGGVTVATAISFFENSVRALITKEITYSYLFYLPGAVLGASLAVPMLVEPWLLLVLGLPAPVIWLMLRSYARLMHRFTDLTQIHEFSSQVGRTTHLEEMANTAVNEIAAHLRAEHVTLVVWDTGAGEIGASVGKKDLLDSLPCQYDEAILARYRQPEPALVETQPPDHDFAQMLSEQGIGQALVVVLEGDEAPLGLLVVANRGGASSRFDADDRSRLRAIGEQLTVAIRKAQMHFQIQHDATHDRLTGLPNRSFFEAYAHQIVTDPQATSTAVFMLDLDRFKEVNDTLGHAAGDLLLQKVGARLGECLETGDLVARFGGDEFAMLVPGGEKHEAELLAARISTRLEEPFTIADTTVAIGASIGIAMAPTHSRDVETLLRYADLAMYDAKRRHSRASVYEAEHEVVNSVRLAMLGDLREAINAGGIDVHFQPKTDIRTNAVVSVEALARWQSPIHGSVGPDVFIPLAEQAGLIGPLTDLVLDRSLTAVQHWRDIGYDIAVAVNLSTQSLLNEDLPLTIADKLTTHRIPAHRLTIEITEQSVLGDSPRTFSIIDQLHRLGVKFSIDDFGTGHSSLVNLRRLPIAELKIDRSFVEDMLVEHADEVIVKSTIDLGHNLGFDVVAEGVETEGVRERLRSLGCDLVQGFGICRPLPIDQLDRWLATVRTFPFEGDPVRSIEKLTGDAIGR